MLRTLRLHDPTLFVLALIATGLGLLFIFDAGYARSLQAGRGPIPREFVAQLIFAFVALGAGAVAARIKSEQWRKWSKMVWLLCLISLVLPLLPGIGMEMNGAQRWVNLGPITVQPAEFAKVAVIIYLAGAFANRAAWPKKVKRYKDIALRIDNIWIPKIKRFLPAVWVLLGVALIELEPDLGTAAVVAATAFAMFFVGGVSRKSMLWATALAALAVVVLVNAQPYRMERVANHQHRWTAANIDDTGYQTVQSELAMATGGLFGVGIGSGRAKHVLPAATTDFLPATVGEEFGLVGMLAVMGVIGGLAIRMFMLARTAPTPFGSLVLCGVGSWLTIQSCVNIMMANGLLPAIGIPLPFMSSGGSSLLALWLAMGLCQSALAPVAAKEEARAPDRYGWRDRRTRLSRA